jgi:hypothetical protein
VGKSFPHPVGAFCTHLEPPSCHIAKIIFLGGWEPPFINRGWGLIQPRSLALESLWVDIDLQGGEEGGLQTMHLQVKGMAQVICAYISCQDNYIDEQYE